MDAYANVNDLEHTISTFRKMEEYGLKPDTFTYGTLVKAFVTNNRLDDALVILEKMKTSSIIPSQVKKTIYKKVKFCLYVRIAYFLDID